MLSIIVPAHNEELLLGRTLDARLAATRALDHPFEIIAANDASTDRTAVIAEEHSVRGASQAGGILKLRPASAHGNLEADAAAPYRSTGRRVVNQRRMTLLSLPFY